MRRLVIAALLASSSSSAMGAPGKPKPIDIAPVADKLVVWKDEFGNFYVTPKPAAFASFDEAGAWVFYGDGKTMYQQRIIGSSATATNQYEWYVWAPRAKGMQAAMISLLDDNLAVECTHKKDGKRPLTMLKADEAKGVLKRATFQPPLWTRQAHFLARDDDGVYYFVDELREELGGLGYRVYVGQKGSMKELPMTNMASDSAGEIFATKTGQLKILAEKDGKAFWIKGGKKVELTVLPPTDNRYLIYRELGIYAQLGTVCEDL